MAVLVVIVNYRSTPLAIDCLASLAGEVLANPGTCVTVVERGSGDDSAQRLLDAIGQNGWSWASVMPLSRNGGFAFGNNSAIAPALSSAEPPAFVWLLNPDTIVRDGALTELLAFMQTHPQVGIAGSRLQHRDGTAQRSAFRFVTLLGEADLALRLGAVSRLLERFVIAPPVRDEPHVCDWVAGASMLVRREVFESIGLLDEKYFLYYEETDFCLRAARAGWPTWYVPASRVVHLVGQSSGVTDVTRKPRALPAYWFQSRSHYLHKNFGKLYGWRRTSHGRAATCCGEPGGRSSASPIPIRPTCGGTSAGTVLPPIGLVIGEGARHERDGLARARRTAGSA